MKVEKINELANLWEKTKNPKYKDLWYKYVKKFANGHNTTKRRTVSTTSSVKTNDGTYKVIK